MGLVTGSGIQGMSGIAHVTGTWVNPLLDVTREEIVAFCRSLHLRPRTDPTNADTRFLRNAIRRRGLPGLERAVGRNVREPLVRTAAGLREDADELMRQTFEVLDDVIDETPEARRPPGAPAARSSPGDRRPRGGQRGLPMRRSVRQSGRAGGPGPGGRPARTATGPDSGLKARRDQEYVRLARPSPGVGEPAPPDRERGSRDGHRSSVALYTDGSRGGLRTRYRSHPDHERGDPGRSSPSSERGSAADYAGRKLLLVGVLKGAFVVMADLARYIRLPLEFDFMAVSSYGAATTDLRRRAHPQGPRPRPGGPRRAARRGHRRLRSHAELPAEEPPRAQARVRSRWRPCSTRWTCSRCPLDIRYTGFEIPNEFVVGYGLDYRGAVPEPALHRHTASPRPTAARNSVFAIRLPHPRPDGSRCYHRQQGFRASALGPAPSPPHLEEPQLSSSLRVPSEGRAHAHALDRADHGGLS